VAGANNLGVLVAQEGRGLAGQDNEFMDETNEIFPDMMAFHSEPGVIVHDLAAVLWLAGSCCRCCHVFCTFSLTFVGCRHTKTALGSRTIFGYATE
jgi:hypothetical protein